MQSDPAKLSIGNAAKFLSVSIDTLRRWEKKGKVTSFRSPGGHRYFLKEDLKNVFGKKYYRQPHAEKRREEIQDTPKSSYTSEPTSTPEPLDFPEEIPQFNFPKVMEMESSTSLEPVAEVPSIEPEIPIKIQTNISKRAFIIFFVFFAAMDLILIPIYFFLSR